MEKLTVIKINSVIREAKILLRKSKDPLLRQKVKSLMALRTEFAEKSRRYAVLKKERDSRIERIYQHVVNTLPLIEVDILKNGGRTVDISVKVPKEPAKLLIYLHNLVDSLKKMKIFPLKRHIEKIRECINELDPATVREREFYICCKEYEDITGTILSEFSAIDQFLHPQQNIIVNIRDRFD